MAGHKISGSRPWLTWLLVGLVGLRSLIAPGFMLAATGEGMGGLKVVFCGGLAGLGSLTAMLDPGPVHQHHAAGHHGAEPHREAASLTGVECGLWASSLAGTPLPGFVEPLLPTQALAVVAIHRAELLPASPWQHPYLTRAPPVAPANLQRV